MFPNNMVSNLNYLIRFNNIFAPDPVFVKFCQSSSLKLSYQVWNVVTLSTYRGILPVEVEKGILEHKWTYTLLVQLVEKGIQVIMLMRNKVLIYIH